MSVVKSIEIDGVIGHSDDPFNTLPTVTLAKVKEFVKQLDHFDELVVYINSVGGEVNEGFAIYDYLHNMREKVTTVILGNCMSIATVIYLAGNERYMTRNSQFMIHNPFGSVTGDAKEIDRYQSHLKMVEERLARFYVQKTGIAEDKIKMMMDNETFLSIDEAMEMNFVNGEYQMKAAAMYDKNYKNGNNTIMGKLDKIILDLKGLFAQNNGEEAEAEPSNINLELADGGSIFVEGAEDGDLVGKRAFMVVDGEVSEEAVPDGEHQLAGGAVIVVSEGVITEAKEADPEEENKEAMEKELMQNKIDELMATVEALAAENKEFKNELETNKEEAEKAIQAKVSDINKIEAKFKTLIEGIGELPRNEANGNKVSKTGDEPKKGGLEGFASYLSTK